MGRPVVHFEILGADPAMLREYYGALFEWEFGLGDATTGTVSEPGAYGFIDGSTTGGVGGGAGHRPRALFDVAVPDVEAALRNAERLGGSRVMGPEPASGEQWDTLRGELAATGELVDGVALGPPRAAATVRVRDGVRLVTDGPSAEAKEHLAGYLVVDCPSPERAAEIAARIPSAAFGGVEIRNFF